MWVERISEVHTTVTVHNDYRHRDNEKEPPLLPISLYQYRAESPRPPQWRVIGEAERQDALQRERALLYVAATRARDELVVTTHGQPSALLPG